ncbi:hypothetical protein D3C83_67050 [compost metagenome]
MARTTSNLRISLRQSRSAATVAIRTTSAESRRPLKASRVTKALCPTFSLVTSASWTPRTASISSRSGSWRKGCSL